MDIDQIPQQSPPLQAENTTSITPSFAQKVLESDLFPNLIGSPETTDLEDQITPVNCEGNFIPISAEDKPRLYSPWQTSLIVKLVGRKLSYLVLKKKLQELWKPTEELNLIDLGSEFFLIKFTLRQNMLHALHDGPWFIFNSFLSVQRWEPKFVASQARLAHTAIWARLHELPTEFYNVNVLHKVGAMIGKLLKIDTCTLTTSRGRYACLCVQVSLEQPLLHHLYIGSHKQVIRYEAASLLCTACRRLGHTTRCPYKIPSSNHSNDKRSDDSLNFPETPNHQKQRIEDDKVWQLVSFPSRQQRRFTNKGKQITQQPGKSPAGPIRVNEGKDSLQVKILVIYSFPKGPGKSSTNSTSKYSNYPNETFNDNKDQIDFNVGQQSFLI
ncbi:hypothetical protein FXO37_02221 [Capsicum annuum]|nr:hypothetical protein FXO37_02221 [Capsicum annuum]